MAGTFNVNGSNVGQVLDSNAILSSIVMTGSPDRGYEAAEFNGSTGVPTKGYFCLSDPTAQYRPKILINYYPSMGGGPVVGYNMGRANSLLTDGNIAFGQLRVESIPLGSSWTIVTV